MRDNRYRVLKVFLDCPSSEFGLREISRKIGLSSPSVKKYLLEFEGQGLIRVRERMGNPVYVAEIDSEKFRFYGRLSMQYGLFESGVIDWIWKKMCPEVIIFYGSCAKGEAMENSDVDLFAVGQKGNIDLSKYEKVLGRGIHLMSDKGDKIPKELKNNLANGIIMKGYFKVLK